MGRFSKLIQPAEWAFHFADFGKDGTSFGNIGMLIV
jgi:hypothetical protein